MNGETQLTSLDPNANADQFNRQSMRAILPNGDEIHCTTVSTRFHGTCLFDPPTVFEKGIPKKGSDRRLLQHVKGNCESAFRGSTEKPVIALEGDGQGAVFWAQVGGWVFEIDRAPSWSAERELQGRVPLMSGFGGCPHEGEVEHAIPSCVPSHRIVRAFKVIEGRTFRGKQRLLAVFPEENPNFRELKE